MIFKEKLQLMIKIHTRVVTGIFLFMCIYFFWVSTDAALRIKDVFGVQLIGLISAVAYLPLMTDRELSKTKMIIFNIVYCLTINASVMVIGFLLNWFNLSNKATFIGGELMFVSVYALMMFIAYKIDNSEAKKMNQKLKERNKTKKS